MSPTAKKSILLLVLLRISLRMLLDKLWAFGVQKPAACDVAPILQPMAAHRLPLLTTTGAESDFFPCPTPVAFVPIGHSLVQKPAVDHVAPSGEPVDDKFFIKRSNNMWSSTKPPAVLPRGSLGLGKPTNIKTLCALSCAPVHDNERTHHEPT